MLYFKFYCSIIGLHRECLVYLEIRYGEERCVIPMRLFRIRTIVGCCYREGHVSAEQNINY